MLLFMIIILKKKNYRRAKYQEWEDRINLAINTAIFSDEEDIINRLISSSIIPQNVISLMRNSTFRKLLTSKIVAASKSLSGNSESNLKKLYVQLGLEQYALLSLKQSLWHIKAKRIQEIGVMGLQSSLNDIKGYLNDKNELIRTEAQVSVIKLTGFSGLNFLDSIHYKISEWNQIILLRELSHLPPEDFHGMNKWLKSDNNSVVAFALKLAGIYHRFAFYNDIEICLYHSDPDIRFQAIQTIAMVYKEKTAALLKGLFPEENQKNKKEIIKALKVIGNEEDIPFLFEIVGSLDNEMKLMVVDTIANISSDGLTDLKKIPEAHEYPLNEMIQQIEYTIKQ